MPDDVAREDDPTDRASLRSSLSLVCKKLREDGVTFVHDPLPEEMQILLDALERAERQARC